MNLALITSKATVSEAMIKSSPLLAIAKGFIPAGSRTPYKSPLTSIVNAYDPTNFLETASMDSIMLFS